MYGWSQNYLVNLVFRLKSSTSSVSRPSIRIWKVTTPRSSPMDRRAPGRRSPCKVTTILSRHRKNSFQRKLVRYIGPTVSPTLWNELCWFTSLSIITISGPGDECNWESDLRGLIPRTLKNLFQRLGRLKAEFGDKVQYDLSCTLLEIYNEQVRWLVMVKLNSFVSAD